jgi:hypothetical protein
MKLWNIYFTPNGKTIVPLGGVKAENGPDAILRAWKKWPEFSANHLPQKGFFARKKADDGRLFTSAESL